MNHLLLAAIGLLVVGALLTMPLPAQSTHSTSTVDQVSIDMDEAGNGVPAVGDRDGDTVPDAEGFPVLACGLPPFGGNGVDDDLDGTSDDGCPGGPASIGTPEQGVCGNGIDDDRSDIDGSTILGDSLAEVDGSADDGCQVTLGPRQTCVEIIDDGVLNADEDIFDRAFVDITVGAQPGPTGGIPLDRPLTAFQFNVEWSAVTGANDVLNIGVANPYFLIVSLGDEPGGPFVIFPDLSSATSPYSLGVVGGGTIPGYNHLESGPGVLARVTVEGNDAGLTRIAHDLTAVTSLLLLDDQNEEIPVGMVNNAFLAVSKDLDGDGTVEPVGSLGRELFTCSDDSDGDGVLDVQDGCPLVPGLAVDGGCPPPGGGGGDRDGDGVPDVRDYCVMEPGPAQYGGCPPPAVGGIVGLVSPDAGRAQRPAGADHDASPLRDALFLGVAVGAFALTAGAWYAGKRPLR